MINLGEGTTRFVSSTLRIWYCYYDDCYYYSGAVPIAATHVSAELSRGEGGGATG